MRFLDLAPWVVVPLLVALFSWHAVALEAQPGPDSSWGAALHMAYQDKITFGQNLVFTYGPLGFLSIPTLWYADTGAIAFFYLLALRVALAAAVFAGARRSYGVAVGVVVALVVASASNTAYEVVPFLIFAVWVVNALRDDRHVPALAAFGGAFAGLEMLNKESTGIALVVLVTIMALTARGSRRINLAIALAAALFTALLGWAVAGQPVDALPAYVHGMARIVSGYAGAMSLDQANLAWQYLAGWVAFAFGLAAAVHMTSDHGPLRRRVGIVALWIAFCFFQYKEGFVRHDQFHGTVFFVTVMGGFFALRWRSEARLVGLGMAAALLVFTLATEGTSFSAIIAPGPNARSAIEQIGEVTNASKRRALVARGKASMRAFLPLDRESLALLRGQTVHVSPEQAAVAWVYDLDWRPLPVFQSYSAYTTGLDQQDADMLQSSRAPRRILRNLEPGIDGRLQEFDESATTRAILCRYRELRATALWQVLGHAQDRCAPPVSLETVHAGWGEPVAIPPPPNAHSIVLVRIGGVDVHGLERLRALLYKPEQRNIVLDGTPHRLVEATATDGLLLRASPGVDFAPPFNMAPNSATLLVGKMGQDPTVGQPLTYSFFAQSVTAGPR